MKKIIFASVVMLCMAQAGMAQMLDRETTLSSDNLRGPVQSVATYILHPKTVYTEQEYREHQRTGKPLPKFSRDLYEEKSYDKKGYVMEYKDHTFNRVKKYSYDTDSRLLEERTSTDGVLSTIYKYEYDQRGYPLHASKTYADGKAILEDIYTYETDGDKIVQKCIERNVSGPESNSIITYAPDLSIISFEQKSNRVQMFVELDKKMSSIKKVTFSQQGMKGYSVAEQNKMKTFYQKATGDYYLAMVRENDQYGNMIKETTYNEQELQTGVKTYKYTYDSHGNWTRKECTSGRSKEDTKVRTIKYYSK